MFDWIFKMPVFDHKRMLENLGNDEDLVQQLVFIFFQEKEKFLEKIRFSINQKDYKNITMAAHTVKGMLGNFFAEDAVNSAIQAGKSCT